MAVCFHTDQRISRLRRHWTGAVILLAFLFLLFLPIVDAQNAIRTHYTDLWAQGEYHEALRELEALMEASQGHIQSNHQRHLAYLYFETGQIEKAIRVMETVADTYPEPANTLELALMYKYVGRMDMYETKLGHAARQSQGRYQYFRRRDDSLVAMGRVAELLGESPRTVLNTHYGVLLERNPNNIGAHIAAGELALSRGGYGIAAGHFQDALKIDPEDQNALAGLAETYWKSSDPRLQEILPELLKLNPNHPRGKALEVEQLLDEGKSREALRLIDEALAINPVSLRFRSLQSAAYFLEDDLDAMARVQREVLEFNPVCSEVFRTTGRIASRHYRFKEGSEFQQQALAVDPRDFEARALFTQDLMRLGHETTGRKELELAFSADPYNVQLYNLLELMDTLETFEVIERGPFVLKLPEHEAPLIAEDALRLLDEAWELFTAKYDVEIEAPVLIEMFDDHDDFMVRSVGLPGNVGHLGICFGNLVTMDSPSARPRGSWNWRSVLWHEFMHVITLGKTNNRMPRWLSEGISVHEEGEYSEAWKSRLDGGHRMIVEQDGIPSVRELDGYFTKAKSMGHMMFGYFAAGEFVDFYVGEYSTAALNEALDAIGEGADTLDALASASGEPLREMDRKYQAYMTKRFEVFENLPPLQTGAHAMVRSLGEFFQPGDEPPVVDEDRSSPYTDLITAGEKAEGEEDWAAAEQAYRAAHELFPDNTAGNAPLRRLARIHRELGDEEKLRATLEAILYWTPVELEAGKELLELHRQAERWSDVARVADWTVGIDPYDLDLQRALAEGLIASGQVDEAIAALGVLTHLDRGREAVHRLTSAELLTERGDWATAKRQVLKVLEDAPHFWDAQELLLTIVDEGSGEDSAPAPPPEEPGVLD